MNNLKRLLGIFAFSLLVLGLPSLASAQYGNRNNDYGRNRNGGYNNNNDLRYAIKSLKDQSRDLSRQIDRQLDNSRIDGTNREDRINDVAKNFKDAASRLESRFDNGRNPDNAYSEANQVLDLGRRLERIIRNSRVNAGFQNNWNSINQNLNTIANYYGSNNNRRGNGGGRRN